MTTISSSSSTSTISSAGIGSGLDVTSIISKLMAVEQLPLTALQSQATSMQTKLSSFGQIQSLVSTFQDSAKALTDKTAFTATKVASTSTAVTATTTSAATAGNYSVSVSAIAAPQTVVSTAGQFASSTDRVGTGSITITLGTLSSDQSSFTPKGGATAVTIPITSGNNTLQGVADAINSSTAGITASIVTDSSGSRLAFTSNSTGAANGFTITTTDDDGANSDASGLSRLAFDPANSASQMTLAQPASDTKAKINGIDVSSATADLTNVIPGVSFNAAAITTTPATISVTKDTDSVKTLMTNFVTAYNALNNYIKSQTSYDASTQVAGLLQGDSTTVSLQNQMRAMISGAGSGSSTFSTMSSMGFQLQKDGSLKLDDTTANKALANLSEMSKALATNDVTTPSTQGFATKINNWSTTLLSSNGAIATKENSIQAQITANGKSQTAMQSRISATQARLTAQYNTLDTTMSQANSLASYIQQQFYSKSSSSSSS